MLDSDQLALMESTTSNTTAGGDTLLRISEALQRRSVLLKQVAHLDELIKTKLDDLKAVEEKELPELLDSVGMKELTLSTGEKLTLSDHVSVNITKAAEDDAFSWLEQNGYGDIIKNELTVKFDKDENEKVAVLRQQLTQEGFHPSVKKQVHPSTLKAWSKEVMRKGVMLPTECFSQWVTRKVTIKQ